MLVEQLSGGCHGGVHCYRELLSPQDIGLDTAQEVIDGFAWLEFTNCIGVIDGTLMFLFFASEFINRKRYFSMVLQGPVDPHGRFISINVG